MKTIRKLFILNFAGACLVAWAWTAGYVSKLVASDGSHMTSVIAFLFLVGVVSTFYLAYKTDKYLGQWGWLGGERAKVYRWLIRKSGHLHDILASLFILGIIGNAIGFLTAFSGIDISSVTTPEGLRKAGVQLMSGSGTAFGSTIVGLSLAVWTMWNLRILTTSMDRLAPHE